MPDKLFYDTVPEWDEIRASARFIVMTNLALAILASYCCIRTHKKQIFFV